MFLSHFLYTKVCMTHSGSIKIWYTQNWYSKSHWWVLKLLYLSKVKKFECSTSCQNSFVYIITLELKLKKGHNWIKWTNDFICAPDSRFRKNLYHHHIFVIASKSNLSALKILRQRVKKLFYSLKHNILYRNWEMVFKLVEWLSSWSSSIKCVKRVLNSDVPEVLSVSSEHHGWQTRRFGLKLFKN